MTTPIEQERERPTPRTDKMRNWIDSALGPRRQIDIYGAALLRLCDELEHELASRDERIAELTNVNAELQKTIADLGFGRAEQRIASLELRLSRLHQTHAIHNENMRRKLAVFDGPFKTADEVAEQVVELLDRIAEEREACAKVCEDRARDEPGKLPTPQAYKDEAMLCAAVIRARAQDRDGGER